MEQQNKLRELRSRSNSPTHSTQETNSQVHNDEDNIEDKTTEELFVELNKCIHYHTRTKKEGVLPTNIRNRCELITNKLKEIYFGLNAHISKINSETVNTENTEKINAHELMIQKQEEELRQMKQQNLDILNTQRQILDKLNNMQETQKSQSQTETKENTENTKQEDSYNKNTILIKPQNDDNRSIEQLRNKLQTVKTNIIPKDIRIKKTAIAIECETTQEKQHLNDMLKEKDFITVEPKKRRTKVIIFNVPEVNSDTDMTNTLQKELRTQDLDIRSIQLKSNKMNSRENNWIIELDRKHAQDLVKKRHIIIGFKRVGVDFYKKVVRCYRCQALGHTRSQCENKEYCNTCAKQHNSNTCSSLTTKCINCIDSNRRYNTKYNINHTTYDSSCQTYKEYLRTQ